MTSNGTGPGTAPRRTNGHSHIGCGGDGGAACAAPAA
ncbi:hypothetical protein SUDANB15_04713 [Streptomyces sp. enrichment culture]